MMQTSQVLTLFVFILPLLTVAQTPPDSLTGFGRFNLGIHGAELSYELPVSQGFVWENTVGIGMGSSVERNSVSYYFPVDRPAPFLKSEFKWMYNRVKRARKGRSHRNNSGNYLALQTKYSFGRDVPDLNRTLLTEVHWGIQRPLGKRFLFNLHLGLGRIQDFDNDEGMVSPTVGLRFGYKLF